MHIFFNRKGVATLAYEAEFTVVTNDDGEIVEIIDPGNIVPGLDQKDLAERIHHITRDQTVDKGLRPAMDALASEWRAYVERYTRKPIHFPGPHCGVHIREWRAPYDDEGWSEPSISIECDPGYCGIGAAMDPHEARRLGEALIRAAEIAEKAAR